jgi:hypothetical protein
MGKSHRGKGLKSLPGHGKGTCPICQRKSVKLLWPGTVGGESVRVCKHCRSKVLG